MGFPSVAVRKSGRTEDKSDTLTLHGIFGTVNCREGARKITFDSGMGVDVLQSDGSVGMVPYARFGGISGGPLFRWIEAEHRVELCALYCGVTDRLTAAEVVANPLYRLRNA